jgi:hypothetical protein
MQIVPDRPQIVLSIRFGAPVPGKCNQPAFVNRLRDEGARFGRLRLVSRREDRHQAD